MAKHEDHGPNKVAAVAMATLAAGTVLAVPGALVASYGYSMPEPSPDDVSQGKIGEAAVQAQSESIIPSATLVQEGGRTVLKGTNGADQIVTEKGLCGEMNMAMHLGSKVLGQGDPYCVTQGEIEVIQAGEGADFILAAAGTSQEFNVGNNHNTIAVYNAEMGEKTIIANGSNTDKNTIRLHDSILERGVATVSEKGDGITLTFSAASGRETGSITFDKGDVSRLEVVDSQGNKVFNSDCVDIGNAKAWQQQLDMASGVVQGALTGKALEEARAAVDQELSANAMDMSMSVKDKSGKDVKVDSKISDEVSGAIKQLREALNDKGDSSSREAGAQSQAQAQQNECRASRH